MISVRFRVGSCRAGWPTSLRKRGGEGGDDEWEPMRTRGSYSNRQAS